MATRKNYTSSEDSVIKSAIIRNPGNLLESFETASKQLKGRTEKSVHHRWYHYLKFGKKIIILKTAGVTLYNTKNIPRIK